jgi:Flp pilus assembly protein TadG
MKFQRGQSLVEFALVLPIFLLLVYGIFYIGMIFADYMILSDVARSSAREASITDAAGYADNYKNIRNKYSDVELPLDVFTLNKDYLTITYDSKKQNVQVDIKAPLNIDGSSIAHTFYNLLGNTGQDYSMNITYTMYSEYKPTK